MNERKAVETLKEVKNVLDNHKITFWLDCGTLLGAIRDKKFIPWDTDIDLCIKDAELYDLKKAVVDLEERGFEVYCKKRDDLNHSILVTKNQIPVVLFLPYVYDNCFSFKYILPRRIVGKVLDYLLWTFKLRNPKTTKNYGSIVPYNLTKTLVRICSKIPEWIRIYISDIIDMLYHKIDSYHVLERVPDRFFKELKTIKFYGMDVCVPKRAEEFIIYRYGKNWKNPTKNCTHGKDNQIIVQKCMYGELLKK